MSELTVFRSQVKVIEDEDANILRLQYLQTFIDTGSKKYQSRILDRRKYADGWYYTGYLWEHMRNSRRVPCSVMPNMVDEKHRVYVLWDLHSSEKIVRPGYWKFPREAVLQVAFGVLIDNLQWMPEDIYIFDRSLDWTLVMTHEEDLDCKQFCFCAGRIAIPNV